MVDRCERHGAWSHHATAGTRQLPTSLVSGSLLSGLDALHSTTDCAAFSTLHVTCHVTSGCAAVRNVGRGLK